jgi:plastocyanin
MAVVSLSVVTGPGAVLAGGRDGSLPDSKHAVSITIGNFNFAPQTLIVPVGTELVWTNQDDAPHTVKGVDGGSPIASQPLDTGDKYTVVISRPGTYKYFCTLHPMMVGTIVVQ